MWLQPKVVSNPLVVFQCLGWVMGVGKRRACLLSAE